MSVVRQIQTQQVDQPCPVCQKGWMRPTGILPSEGQYEHSCNSCGYKAIYTVRYPYLVQ